MDNEYLPSEQVNPDPPQISLQQIELVISAAEADLCALRAWLDVNPNTSVVFEVGARLVEAGRMIRAYGRGDSQ